MNSVGYLVPALVLAFIYNTFAGNMNMVAAVMELAK